MRLNAENEADMYHFVTMLRQASRMDIFEQLKKLKDAPDGREDRQLEDWMPEHQNGSPTPAPTKGPWA